MHVKGKPSQWTERIKKKKKDRKKFNNKKKIHILVNTLQNLYFLYKNEDPQMADRA